ncbi:dihydrofolate reductase [Escherichia coli]|uniref:dihydrofolate reductase n=1 Tax=Escherichia coli TaxID=562 RepID=UPI003D7CCCF9
MNSESVRIYLVAAMGANRVIGNGPNIPWKIPGEQKIFRRLTEGKVVVMGRKTFESIGKPLPNRHTLVISRQANGTVAKLAMRQPFVLFKGLTFQKLCLPGAFRPGDHHNKMLRPGLCVVHASPQYL